MSESVTTRRFGNSGFPHGLFHRFLQIGHGFVQMMSAFFSYCPIRVVARCRKYPLPSPLFSRIGIFAIKSVRQSDSAQAAIQIALVLLFDKMEVLSKRFLCGRGKHRVPIFIALPCANHNLAAREIDIFDPQSQTLH